MQLVVMYHNNTFDDIKRIPKIKIDRSLEYISTHIIKNPHLKKQAIFVLGSLFYCKEVLAAPKTAAAIGKVNIAGNAFLNISRSIGYWACIIMCIIEIIRSLMQGDTKSISKIMMKYAMSFAALYFFPWLLDMIRDIFA